MRCVHLEYFMRSISFFWMEVKIMCSQMIRYLGISLGSSTVATCGLRGAVCCKGTWTRCSIRRNGFELFVRMTYSESMQKDWNFDLYIEGLTLVLPKPPIFLVDNGSSVTVCKKSTSAASMMNKLSFKFSHYFRSSLFLPATSVVLFYWWKAADVRWWTRFPINSSQ